MLNSENISYICTHKAIIMNLSEHLSLAEVIKSDTAKRYGIDNHPTSEHLYNLKLLAETIFEPIRKHFNVPIYISSGYRSKELNIKLKGVKSSQHLTGEALDIDMDGTDLYNIDVFMFIKDNLPFDQLISEFPVNGNPSWIHVSFKALGKQRHQIMYSKKVNNNTVYVSCK